MWSTSSNAPVSTAFWQIASPVPPLRNSYQLHPPCPLDTEACNLAGVASIARAFSLFCDAPEIWPFSYTSRMKLALYSSADLFLPLIVISVMKSLRLIRATKSDTRVQ